MCHLCKNAGPEAKPEAEMKEAENQEERLRLVACNGGEDDIMLYFAVMLAHHSRPLKTDAPLCAIHLSVHICTRNSLILETFLCGNGEDSSN